MSILKNHVEKVAIVGVSGNSGKYIAKELVATGKHKVTALTRNEGANPLPPGIECKEVDYSNQRSLIEALKGQDALVITMSKYAPPDQEQKLVEAAISAGVPWIVPNIWSPDIANEELCRDVRMPESKRTIRTFIEANGKSWIGFITGFWYEWSISLVDGYGIDFKNKKATLYDDGERKISTTTWPQVGRAVARFLSLPIASADGLDIRSFKNNFVYVSSFQVSQKDMLASACRVTDTSPSDWQIMRQPVKDRYHKGLEQLANGNKHQGFIKLGYSRIFFPDDSGNYAKTRGLQNRLLELPQENIDEFTKIGMARALGVNQEINGY